MSAFGYPTGLLILGTPCGRIRRFESRSGPLCGGFIVGALLSPGFAVAAQCPSVLPANVCRLGRFVNRSGASAKVETRGIRGGATLGAVSLWSIVTYPMSLGSQGRFERCFKRADLMVITSRLNGGPIGCTVRALWYTPTARQIFPEISA